MSAHAARFPSHAARFPSHAARFLLPRPGTTTRPLFGQRGPIDTIAPSADGRVPDGLG